MKYFIFIVISAWFFIACQREECPESFIIEQDPIPQYVNNRIRYSAVDTLKFMNENFDTVIYEKFYEEVDNVKLELIEPTPCDIDPSQKVDIFYERIWNRMHYASVDFDTLQFDFNPLQANLLNFDWDTYEKYYTPGTIYREPPFFAQRLFLKIQDTQLNHGLLISNSIRDDYDLLGLYQVLDNQIDDVYFWTINDSSFLYFTLEHGLVGFRVQDQIDWIRVL